ncbi:MAG: hypothetical protein L0G55_11810 [Corynebacterium sp.]|nr:hypothetical protein [Corynebacterium sp.]MDN6324760.1 hypothetical protein [Corynebacterium sp.]
MTTTLLGGVPAATHLRLCLAQARSEIAGRLVTWLLVLIVPFILFGETVEGVGRQVAVAVLFGIVGGSSSGVLTMSTRGLVVFGIGARAAKAHVVMATVVGTAVCLAVLTVLWAVGTVRGGGLGAWFALTVLVIVALSTLTVVLRLRELRGAAVDAGGGAAASLSTRWGRRAQAPDGHVAVMRAMAGGGVLAPLIAFLVVMIPVQLVFRLLGSDLTVVAVILVVALTASVVFGRLVQAERAAMMWTVFGGVTSDWQRAVVRGWWVAPVGFALVYLVAWGLEQGVQSRGGAGALPMLSPGDPGEWMGALCVAANCGFVTVAMTLSGLSVTVTQKGAGRRVISVMVVVANLIVLGYVGTGVVVVPVVGEVAPRVVVALAWTAVAGVLFARAGRRMDPASGVTTRAYFGFERV